MNPSKEFEQLFARDLRKLKEEIESYPDETSLWIKSGDIKNSAGNLALHLCGNLQHFIGAVLSGTDYVRNRPFEFEGSVERKQLLDEIDKTLDTVSSFFQEASQETYEKKYPIEVFGNEMSTFYFIVHLQGHLNYHLGQVNYHRRILLK